MSLFESRYYNVNTFLLRLTGLWPYQNPAKKRLIRIVAVSSLIFQIFPLVARIYTIWGSLNDTLDCLPPICILFTSICKSMVYIFKEHELREILDCMQEDWKLWSYGKESEILKEYAGRGRIFSLLFTGNSYLTLSTFLIMSLTPMVLDELIPLDEPRIKQMIYPVEFFVDPDKYINWIMLYNMWSATCTVTVVLACESMYAICIQHACGLFAIVGHRLKNVIEEIDFFKADEKERDNVLYKYMRFSIERHSHAIKFANILEAYYSPFLFFGMAFNMLEITCTGFQTLLSLGNMGYTVKYASFTLGVIIHIYLISLPAQKLLDHSSAIADELYGGCWYQMSAKSKNLLRMIIMQARIPCTLTALKFYSVNLVTFSVVLKTSFSYFTVLSSTRN